MRRRCIRSLACMVAMWSAGTAPAPAEVSQRVLLERGADAPNLTVVVDDAAAMARRHVPDTLLPASERRADRFVFHPGDAPALGARGGDPGEALLWGDAAGDALAARMRSASFNRLYYDPAVRYRPWARADGSLLPEADPAAALRDPLWPGSGVDLRAEIELPSGTPWCRGDSDGVTPVCAPLAAPVRWAPALWFEWNGGPGQRADSFVRVRIVDSASFDRPATRTDCAPQAGGARCTAAQELLNFANWFVYHRTRLYAAIAALSHAMARQDSRLRLAYGRPGAGPATIDGQPATTVERGVRPFSGADRAAFFDWLHRLPARGRTPLHRALDDVGRYHLRTLAGDAGSPWSDAPGSGVPSFHSACRRSHLLLLGDGDRTGRVPAGEMSRANVDGSDGPQVWHADGVRSWHYVAASPWRDTQAGTLADAAMYYYARDLHPGVPNALRAGGAAHPFEALLPQPASKDQQAFWQPFWQSLTTSTMGFGAGGSPSDDALLHAALDGGGRYFDVFDGPALEAGLLALLGETRPAAQTPSGVATNGRSPGAGLRKYVASYDTADGSGDLVALPVDEAGQAGDPVWQAAAQLPAPAARQIWSWDGVQRAAVPFTWSALQRSGLASRLGEDAGPELVDFLRGDRTREGTRWRRRASVLGDIVHSQPLWLRGAVDAQYQYLPAGTPGRDTYRAFVRAKAAREAMLLFNANDGLLHAVRESDGREAFAFAPPAVLPLMARQARLAFQHRFVNDGPLVEADAWLDGRWRNLVIGTAGAAVPSVFALDATDLAATGAAQVLWEATAEADGSLGRVLAAPEVGMLRNGRWVAVLGNGYDSASGQARLVVLDLRDGRLLRTLPVGAADGNGLGGVRLARDANNRVVAAYAGDLRGRLWRFDLQADEPAQWAVGHGGQPLFTALDDAGAPRAITAAPAYLDHPLGGQLVLVGTGRLFEDADADSRQVQAIYGLWDTVAATQAATRTGASIAVAQLTRHALEQVDVASAQAGSARLRLDVVLAGARAADARGWMLPLPPALRDVRGAQFGKGLVRFSLMAPAPRDPLACSDTSPAGLELQLQPLSGEMPPSALFDTNGDGVVNRLDIVVAGLRTAGEAPAQIALDAAGRGRLVGSAGGSAPVDYGALRPLRRWRQIVNPPR